MTRNGVCTKDKLGKRRHEFSEKQDGMKHKFTSCDKCGTFFATTQKK